MTDYQADLRGRPIEGSNVGAGPVGDNWLRKRIELMQRKNVLLHAFEGPRLPEGDFLPQLFEWESSRPHSPHSGQLRVIAGALAVQHSRWQPLRGY